MAHHSISDVHDYEALHPLILRAPTLSQFNVVWSLSDRIRLAGQVGEDDEDRFVADLRYEFWTTPTSSFVSVLSQAMPLGDISVLSVHHHKSSKLTEPSAEDWQRLLHACPRVANLYAGGGASLSLAIFLGQPSLRETWDGTHLRKLVFKETDVQETAASDGRTLLEHLLDFALAHTKSALACTVLGFDQCFNLPGAQETKAQFGPFFPCVEFLET
jgi:hypothetical protein